MSPEYRKHSSATFPNAAAGNRGIVRDLDGSVLAAGRCAGGHPDGPR